MTQQNLRPPSRPNVHPQPPRVTSPMGGGGGDLTEQLAAARAEVAALRSAVEWIESLAKVQATACRAMHRADHERNWLDVLAIIERIPASVGSSGEAESGEGGFCVDCPDHEACSTGYPCDVVKRAAHTPAPVSSGGQADGEGEDETPEQPDGIDTDSRQTPDPQRAAERLLAYVSEMGDGLYSTVGGYPPVPLYGRDIESVAKAALAARPVPQADGVGECCAAFTEAACEVGHRILIDDGDGTDYACPVCALAARPVLSREAIVRLLCAHYATGLAADRPPLGTPWNVECTCGSVIGYTTTSDIEDRHVHHLADVLTAGGEQA